MATLRTIIIGASALGAAGGVAVLPTMLQPEAGPDAAAGPGYEVCLKSDLVFFAGAPARCYAPQDVRALSGYPVVDRDGAAVTLSMTHPSDASMAPMACRTCADYREARFDGWFAANGREMRREGYFVRACGVLAAIGEAQAPAHSYFKNGSPSDEDVAGLADGMSFGESAAQDVHVSSSAGHAWRITADSANVTIQELANADFDNDGTEEILVYFAGDLTGGTAVHYDVGYLEKDAADAPLRFTPLALNARKTGAAGG